MLVALLLSCATTSMEQRVVTPGDYSSAVDRLRSEIQGLMKSHRIPGVVSAVIDDQQVVWQEAFGLSDVENNTPATHETVYKVGSISKVFTAIEIMRMVEEGLVDLDSPITDYLPDFSIKNRFHDSEPITLRSILAHRSGLPRNGNITSWFWDAEVDVLRDLTYSVRDSYAAYPAGVRYKYSNFGYNVLGRLIEVKRDVPFAFYMKDALLDPIGMKDSTFLSEYVADDRSIAAGYYWSKRKNNPYDQYDLIKLASSNLHATADDLIEFARFMFRGGEIGGKRVIRKDTLDSMFEGQYSRPRDPQSNGLGWFLDREYLSELVAFHTGDNNGTKSLIGILPHKKLGLVLLGNSDRFEEPAIRLMFEAFALLLEAKNGTAPSKKDEPEPLDVSRDVLERYTGKYIFNGDIIQVSLKGDKLRAKLYGVNTNLIPHSSATFRLKHWLIDLGFIDYGSIDASFFIDDEGEDVMVLTLSGSVHFTCPRYPEVSEVPPAWDELRGEYDVWLRSSSRYWEGGTIGREEIKVVDDVLLMPGLMAALKPIGETEILLVGGVFDGETILYDKRSGSLTWQDKVYRPISKERRP
jgi:CubicO group peptidase (beta-lactamase class C family)